MRHFPAALAITALLCGSAFASTITVDGDYGDWTALGLVQTDPTGDNPGENPGEPNGAVDIYHYGATIIDGTLYAFTELTEPLTTYAKDTRRGFDGGPVMGMYINADQSEDTVLGGAFLGIDLVIETHDALNASIGVDYWGADDNIGNGISAYYNHGTAAIVSGGYVVEWSAPVSDIISALSGLPDNVVSGSNWTIYLGGEGKIKNVDGSTSLEWGRDYAGPINVVVPEPGTLALLAAAGLALALAGARRLRL